MTTRARATRRSTSEANARPGPGATLADGVERPSSALPSGAEAERLPGGWHAQVQTFKRTLLERTLAGAGGNRTHTARALGLQRTYLQRLIRELEVAVPAASRGRATR